MSLRIYKKDQTNKSHLWVVGAHEGRGSLYYHQFQPHPILGQFVQCYWTVRADARTLPTPEHGVIPAGYVDLVFNFEPLRMSDSGILDRWKIVKGSVPVYTIRNGQLAPWRRDWQYEVNAFAGICSTVEDLAKWDAALRAGMLLKQTSLDLMWTPAKLNNGQEAVLFGDAYGFGWTLGEEKAPGR